MSVLKIHLKNSQLEGKKLLSIRVLGLLFPAVQFYTVLFIKFSTTELPEKLKSCVCSPCLSVPFTTQKH